MKHEEKTIKGQALNQAHSLGVQDGAVDLNTTGMVGVVDVVDQCPLVGQWLDFLISNPAAFNQAHIEIAQEYARGYAEGRANDDE